MQKDRSFWPEWAYFLHRWGISSQWSAGLLEMAGPLTLLFAQLIYLGKPFFDGAGAQDRFMALANLLEDPEESHSFAAFLREESIK